MYRVTSGLLLNVSWIYLGNLSAPGVTRSISGASGSLTYYQGKGTSEPLVNVVCIDVGTL